MPLIVVFDAIAIDDAIDASHYASFRHFHFIDITDFIYAIIDTLRYRMNSFL
jgi:hypothetical protein